MFSSCIERFINTTFSVHLNNTPKIHDRLYFFIYLFIRDRKICKIKPVSVQSEERESDMWPD